MSWQPESCPAIKLHFVKFRHAKFGGHHSGSFSKQTLRESLEKRKIFPWHHGLMNGWGLTHQIRLKGESFFSVVGNVIATDSSAFGLLTNTRVRRVGLEHNTCISYPKIQRCKGVAWRTMAVVSSRLMLVGCQGLSVEAKQMTFSILPTNANLFTFYKIQVLHIFLEQMYVSLTQIPNFQSLEVLEALNSWVL